MAISIDPASAASAYGKGSKIAGITAAPASGPSFMDFLTEKVKDVVDTLRGGEAMTAKAVQGKAPLPALVEAVTAADASLQTIIALRDRMIAAYQEIMRMPL